jgi:hypothetical protein
MIVTQTPAPVVAESPYKNAIYLGEVSGGESTNPLWVSEVGNPEFRDALY